MHADDRKLIEAIDYLVVLLTQASAFDDRGREQDLEAMRQLRTSVINWSHRSPGESFRDATTGLHANDFLTVIQLKIVGESILESDAHKYPTKSSSSDLTVGNVTRVPPKISWTVLVASLTLAVGDGSPGESPIGAAHTTATALVVKQTEHERQYAATASRIAEVTARTVELFEGDVKAANRWLTQPVRGLGNQVPLDVAVTQAGAQMVLDLLGRLDHGVFS